MNLTNCVMECRPVHQPFDWEYIVNFSPSKEHGDIIMKRVTVVWNITGPLLPPAEFSQGADRVVAKLQSRLSVKEAQRRRIHPKCTKWGKAILMGWKSRYQSQTEYCVYFPESNMLIPASYWAIFESPYAKEPITLLGHLSPSLS